MTKQELSIKLRELILTHLKSKGWPLVADRDLLVIRELDAMWLKIEQAGLVPKGMTIELFKRIALVKYQQAILKERMSEYFRRF